MTTETTDERLRAFIDDQLNHRILTNQDEGTVVEDIRGDMPCGLQDDLIRDHIWRVLGWKRPEPPAEPDHPF